MLDRTSLRHRVGGSMGSAFIGVALALAVGLFVGSSSQRARRARLDYQRTKALIPAAPSAPSTSSEAAPTGFLPVTPSPSMVRQNGHDAATVLAPVDNASSTRSTLMCLPIRSSIHIRAPPAPQQKERSAERSISCT